MRTIRIGTATLERGVGLQSWEEQPPMGGLVGTHCSSLVVARASRSSVTFPIRHCCRPLLGPQIIRQISMGLEKVGTVRTFVPPLLSSSSAFVILYPLQLVSLNVHAHRECSFGTTAYLPLCSSLACFPKLIFFILVNSANISYLQPS